MDRRYEIILRNDTGGGGSRSPIAGDSRKSDTEKGKGLLSKEGAKAFAQGLVAYRTLKSFGTQILTHEVSLVSLRSGSNEMQERAQFVYEVGNQGIGILESTATAAAVGGWVGAAVGFILSTAHTLVGFSQKQDTINVQRTVEGQSLQLNYIRAGTRGSRGMI